MFGEFKCACHDYENLHNNGVQENVNFIILFGWPLFYAKSERRKYAEKRYASEMIQSRIRHFQDGVALGSKDFIEEVFEQKRDFFSPNRESGARRIPLSKDAMYAMRALKE